MLKKTLKMSLYVFTVHLGTTGCIVADDDVIELATKLKMVKANGTNKNYTAMKVIRRFRKIYEREEDAWRYDKQLAHYLMTGRLKNGTSDYIPPHKAKEKKYLVKNDPKKTTSTEKESIFATLLAAVFHRSTQQKKLSDIFKKVIGHEDENSSIKGHALGCIAYVEMAEHCVLTDSNRRRKLATSAFSKKYGFDPQKIFDELVGEESITEQLNVLKTRPQRRSGIADMAKDCIQKMGTDKLGVNKETIKQAIEFMPQVTIALKNNSFKNLQTKTKISWSETLANALCLSQFDCGMAYLLNNRPQQALVMFEQSILNGLHQAFHGMGLAYKLLGQVEKGGQFLRIGLIEFRKTSDYDLRSIYNFLMVFILSDETSPHVRLLKGVNSFDCGNFKKAERLLLSSQGKELRIAENALANLYKKTNQPDKMMHFLKKAAKGGNPYAQIRLGKKLLKSGKIAKANALFKQVQEKKEDAIQAYFARNLAETALKRNDPKHPLLKMARTSFKYVADRQRHLSLRHSNLSKRDVDAIAEKKWMEIAHQHYRYTLKTIFDQGTKSYREGDRVKAHLWMSFVVDINKDPVALNNLGVLAMEEGDYKKAKDLYYKSAKRGYQDAISNLVINGENLLNAGHAKLAKEFLLIAAKFNDPQAKKLLHKFFEDEI